MLEDGFLGDFKIIRKLGSGSLGDVYLGEHRFIKKKFVLKVLPQEWYSDEEFVAKFENHVGKLALLDHLNIAKFSNVSFDDGLYFIVSEFVSKGGDDSVNLCKYLGNFSDRLPENVTASILRQVASALDFIHKKDGLVHGSLKLNNIVVGEILDQESPHVYLTDVGLSQVVGCGKLLLNNYLHVCEALDAGITFKSLSTSSHNPSAVLSKVSMSFLQNYMFMAPEQKFGASINSQSVKSDVYAFGVLAYFLLMGRFPEGYLVMPSENMKNLRFNWDLLIESTLRHESDNRPEGLVALMNRISGVELGKMEGAIGKMSDNSAHDDSKFDQFTDTRSNVKTESGFTKVSPLGNRCVLSEELSRVNRSSAAVVEDEGQQVERKPIIKESELKKMEYEEDPGAVFKKSFTVSQYKPDKQEVKNIEPIATDMVILEEGEYFRGCNVGLRDEKSRHKIFVDSFAIDIHPVTNEQFLRFLDVMNCEKDCNNNDIILLKDSRIKRVAGKLSIESGYAKHPVVGISWYGAKAYAKWVGKRLPFEGEWEIAASSGTDENIYPFGADIERNQANFFNTDTTPVMSYPSTNRGLYDIAGNVYEWIEDWYAYNYYEISKQEPHNPKGPVQGVYRVLRGGCWKSLREDLRCSHRHRNKPGSMNSTLGFRCAADVKSVEKEG